MFKIFVPKYEGIFKIAADECARYTNLITGTSPEITTDATGDLVVLGSDMQNPLVAKLMLEEKLELPEIRCGSDDYYIQSYQSDGRQLLLLGGGRPRALMYAVYDFLERNGCSWFFDGDVMEHRDSLELQHFQVLEQSRFEYRGLRYFAHRGLHRFQAEHWTLQDWKKEIDWILKKRLNLFMLRIGMDDLFQQTFPSIVSYPPENQTPDAQFARSFNDRTCFWPLKKRGELRKHVLDYAFQRDLMHPEDTGTMSHWYSRTPEEFLQKQKPPFIPQASEGYGEPSGLVWDIRKDEWLEKYFQLTETHCRIYGKPQIFHTIGLAERNVSSDRSINHLWKLYAYRRIIGRLRKSYPDAPLLIASWDFFNTQWTDRQMRELIHMLDPKNTIVLDYTSDSDTEKFWFLNWHVYGKFPWIFGIFQAYEPGSDLRGNYETIRKRLQLAKEDPFCKGMIIWPENSHTDVLMYEFFAANAWKPNWCDVTDFIPVFCHKRYGKRAQDMQNCWQAFLPLIQCGCWTNNGFGGEIFAHLCGNWKDATYNPNTIEQVAAMNARIKTGVTGADEALKLLARMDLEDGIVRRDAIDMARTAAARLFQYVWLQFPFRRNFNGEQKKNAVRLLRNLLQLMTDILGADPDYSLTQSLQRLTEGGTVNPNFEMTLKGNVDNGYCRSFIYELCEALYKPELEIWAQAVMKGENCEEKMSQIRDDFYRKPLGAFQPDTKACRLRLRRNIQQLASAAADCQLL